MHVSLEKRTERRDSTRTVICSHHLILLADKTKNRDFMQRTTELHSFLQEEQRVAEQAP
jgi:putative hemolysin